MIGDSQAAAEGHKISNSPGFYANNNKANPSGATIKGFGGELGALPTNEVYPLFEISNVGVQGKAMMKWTYRGQTYSGADNCSSGYWTANSSFMVKLGKPYVQQVPQ